MCFVDLFPWPPPAFELEPDSEDRPDQLASPPAFHPPSELGSDALPSLASIITGLDDELDPTLAQDDSMDPPEPIVGASGCPPAQLDLGIDIPALESASLRFMGIPIVGWQPEQELPDNYIAAIVDGTPVPESAKCTNAFVGSTFVQGASFHYDGLLSLLFVFSVSGTVNRWTTTTHFHPDLIIRISPATWRGHSYYDTG